MYSYMHWLKCLFTYRKELCMTLFMMSHIWPNEDIATFCLLSFVPAMQCAVQTSGHCSIPRKCIFFDVVGTAHL